jgi:KDO2-lipid IV(A) lauroyltransferase
MNLALSSLKFGVIMTYLLPLKLCDWIAATLGRLFYYLAPVQRGYISANLRHAFHDQNLPPKLFDRYVHRTFANYARCLVDFYRLGTLPRARVPLVVEGVNVENLGRALASKRGAIMLTLHLGNWDYAGAYLAACGYPMNALVEEIEPKVLDFYTRCREATGMRTFPLGKSAFAFLDAIRNNRALAIVGDRDILKNGKTVKFFDGWRKIPANLGSIIARKKIPVVFGYLALNPGDRKKRYVGVVHDPEVFETAEEFERFMVRKFEETIKRYPDQWFVLQPEWREGDGAG